MSDLVIDTQKLSGNIIMLTLKGQLNHDTAPELKALFRKFFDYEGIYRFMIDSSGLTYISSFGIGAFIEALAVCRENFGEIVFLSIPPKIKENFDVFGLTRYAAIYQDKDTALKALR